MLISVSGLAAKIDHTVLKPEATEQQVRKVCEESIEYKVASACVSPCRVPLACSVLESTGIPVCVVIGFPSGVQMTRTKQAEVGEALAVGAKEFDMVINLGWLKDADYQAVERDISAVRAEVPSDQTLKVILETAVLTENEIVTACDLALSAEADFVKTSTGFHPSGGASIEAIKLMRKTVGNSMRIKASGGIRDLETALAMLEVGADRLGMSATTAVLRELGARESRA